MEKCDLVCVLTESHGLLLRIDQVEGKQRAQLGGALAMTQLREDGGSDQVVMVKLLNSGWKMDAF